MSYISRTFLPRLLTGIVAGIAIGAFFLNIDEIATISNTISTWATVIVTFSVFLGFLALIEFHYREIVDRVKGNWQYSIFTLVFLFLNIGIAAYFSIKSPAYEITWLFFTAWPYVGSLAIQGLYQVSAAFRSMRARSVESTIVLICTFIVVMSQIPLAGDYWPQIAPVSDWLLKYPNSGALAGMTVGVGVGVVTLGFRLLFGKEKTLAME